MKTKNLLKKLKGFVSVRNMRSPSSGQEVPNQHIITFDNGKVFKSYDSVIVIKYKGEIYLGEDWDYSRTTGKYRNEFLGESKQETQQKIDWGVYKLLQE